MQRQDNSQKKTNRRKKTKTTDNVTATLQYKPDVKPGFLENIGSAAYSSISTLFGRNTDSPKKVTNPLMRDVKIKPVNEKTETDLKHEELHTRLEGGKDKDPHCLRQQLNTAEDKLAAARKAKDKIDTLLQARRDIRKEMDDIRVQKVLLVPELIKEHANRRVDLFFYLCVLVYKTNVVIEKGNTDRQHGDGDNSVGTAACHSSLIPNPVFKPGPTLANSTFSQLPNIVQPLINYFGTENNAELQDDCEDIFIRDSFNSTVILPVIVNKFDNLLEGTVSNPSELVLKALEIANRTSQGKINPLQAMDEFGAAINAYFNGQEIKYNDEILKPKEDTKNAQSLALTLKYQREGTHRVINPTTGVADRGHFYMLLGLDYRRAAVDFTPNFFPHPILEERFAALQQEMLSPPTIIDAVNRLKGEEILKLSDKTAEQMIELYESYTTRLNLIKDKFEDSTHTETDIKTLNNIENNLLFLDDNVKTRDKQSQKSVKKYKTKASKSVTEAVEKFELLTSNQFKPSMN